MILWHDRFLFIFKITFIITLVGCFDDLSLCISIYMAFLTARQCLALFAGFTVMLVNGSLYVYGTMTPYLLTFLKYKGTYLNYSGYDDL